MRISLIFTMYLEYNLSSKKVGKDGGDKTNAVVKYTAELIKRDGTS